MPERREREAADESVDLGRALIDSLPQIVWVAAADGRLTYMNARWSEYSGVGADAAGLGGWTEALHPDDRAEVMAWYLAAIAAGRPFELQFRLRRADGAYRWHLGRGVPVRDASGQITSWSGTATDIDESRHAANERAALEVREQAVGRQLETSEARYRSLVLATTQMVWTTDATGHTVEDSPTWRAFTGQTLEQWRGEGWLAALHPDDREAVRAAWRRSVAESSFYEVEYRLLRADGVYRTLQARAAPVRGPDGEVREWIGVNMDVTEHREAEAARALLLAREQAARAEAEAANRLKDEFLATLSHELRTPLSAILGWATMLRRGKQEDPQAVARGVEVIERNARAQRRIIDDILDASRIVRGELRVETEAIELDALAREVLETVRPSAEAKAIALRCSVDAGPHRVVGDPARLRQVLWNLLCNAIKFTPNDGEVELTLGRREGEVEVRVRDSGCGIAPEFLPHVFDRFRQGDSSPTRAHGGLGLGLALVRYLVEMHGGRVEAASEGLDRGSMFTLTIPARVTSRPGRSAPRRAPRRSADGGQDLTGLRVLVVEDEDDTRDVIEMVLRGAGALVRSAATAAAALERFAEFAPDLVVSDLGMSGHDGLWLLRELHARSPGLPAIALTGYAAREDAERALAAGFSCYLVKPIEPEGLLAAVAGVHDGAEREPGPGAPPG